VGAGSWVGAGEEGPAGPGLRAEVFFEEGMRVEVMAPGLLRVVRSG